MAALHDILSRIRAPHAADDEAQQQHASAHASAHAAHADAEADGETEATIISGALTFAPHSRPLQYLRRGSISGELRTSELQGGGTGTGGASEVIVVYIVYDKRDLLHETCYMTKETYEMTKETY